MGKFNGEQLTDQNKLQKKAISSIYKNYMEQPKSVHKHV